MNRPSLDVVIPCYNAKDTLERAVLSVLAQSACQRLYLVDDGSSDGTGQLIEALCQAHPEKITGLPMPNNGGAARARNWGAWHSQADLVAFLDADDAYQAQALDPVPDAFYFLPNLSLIRLALSPVDFPKHYTQHPDFAKAWEALQMTVGGNMVFRRALFLAAGGFPQDELFRRFGGEDGALGIALTQVSAVGTLFDQAGVLHHYHPNIHATRLLDAYLFQKGNPDIRPQDQAAADAVSRRIATQLESLVPIVTKTQVGRRPLILSYGD